MAEPSYEIARQAIGDIAMQAFKGGLNGHASPAWWDMPVHRVGPASVSPLVASFAHDACRDRRDTPAQDLLRACERCSICAIVARMRPDGPQDT